MALKHASKNMRKDRDIVLAAVENSGIAITYAPDFHNDKEVLQVASKTCSRPVVYMEEDLSIQAAENNMQKNK